MLIEFDHVSRQFGEFKAVNDISFSIEQGEIIGLLGHNGAGKTTTMKLLTGYLEVSEGEISVDNFRVGRDNILIQQLIGYLPENCPLWAHMSVVDFLRYQASIKNIPAEQQGVCIAQAISKTYLTDKAMQTIGTLSKGYRQRVGVANAILNQPKIIILDEPTNGLDPTQTMHMRSLIKELAKNSTVILSTHILQEVQAVCDRVLIIRSGKLVTDKKLSELDCINGVIVSTDQDHASMQNILKGLVDIKAIKLTEYNAGKYQYIMDVDEGIIPELAKVIHQSGASLFQLSPNVQSLETMFSQDFCLESK